MNFFSRLIEGDLMPHGHCLLWREDLLLLHVGGDVLTALAYFAIPSALIHLVRKRNDLVFNWIFLLFAGFILFCGVTHVISLINIWHGYYFIEGIAKTLTGLISAVTAVMIWRLIPQALALPSNVDLLRKTEELEDLKHQLEKTNQGLEQRVSERTQQLEKLAVTDPLTGISNRRDLMQRLDTEIDRARRYHKPLCVLMIDLDHFKAINDNYGHQAGDEVLIDTTKTLLKLCRTSDTIGRYGGEEFVIVLPEISLDAAVVLAERISLEISQRKVNSIEQQEINYTCSIGVAELTADLDQKSLLHTADNALYKAKIDGRNRVVSCID